MKLPRLVSQIVSFDSVFIVGGTAKAIATGNKEYLIKDIDVLVTNIDIWNDVALLIPKDAKVNSYGGWKFKTEEIEVDIWPESLEHHLKHGKVEFCGKVYAIDFLNNRVYSSEVR